MIAARFIPVLLIDRDRRVVKTIGFGDRTYVGDPFNIIRLFNEKEVDEICVLDIDATKDGRGPDLKFAEAISSECFMPLSFGGGISRLEQARNLVALGVEKIVLRTNATKELVGAIVNELGAQAVIGCIDYRIESGVRYVESSGELASLACQKLIDAGVGELIIQCIDRDGLRMGMDFEGINSISRALPVPVIALGGAGDASHLEAAIRAGADAAASGSAFCFIGRLRGVLITYPSYSDRQKASVR